MKYLILTFFLVWTLPGNIRASLIASGGASWGSSQQDADRLTTNVRDGKGLVLGGNLDPDTPANYTLDATADGNTGFGQNTAWSAHLNNLPVDELYLIIDLGQDYLLDSMNVFNFTVSTTPNNRTNRGVNQADIYYRTNAAGPGNNSNTTPFDTGPYEVFDGTGWTLSGTAGSQTFTRSIAAGTSIAPDNVLLNGIQARYIAFDINSSHGSSTLVGFAELQFFGTAIPEPSTLLLFTGGLAGLYFTRRRAHPAP